MGTVGPDFDSVEYCMFTSEQIKALSVVEIKTPLTFNNLGHPLRDGLYDPLMGPIGSTSDPCGTCKSQIRNCPGHFGHIDLAVPVCNPLFHKAIAVLLRLTCVHCFKLQFSAPAKDLLCMQLKLLNAGYFVEAQELKNCVNLENEDKLSQEALAATTRSKIEEMCANYNLTNVIESTKIIEAMRREFINECWNTVSSLRTCLYCKAPYRRISSFKNTLTTLVAGDNEVTEKKIIMPDECRGMLRKLYMEEKEVLKEMYPVFKNDFQFPTDVFFIDVVLVTPPKVRPVQFINNTISEFAQSINYKEIIQTNIILKNVIKAVQSFESLTEEGKNVIAGVRGTTPVEKLHHCWLELQRKMDCLLDSPVARAGDRQLQGLKQVIEKKAGIIRMNMMGKRVNFAARTVITPDPNLNIDEIGVPEDFAKKLTYPVPVTHYNVEELRRMVKNGPDVYPGANMIENENGSIIRLEGGENNERRREGIAKILLKSKTMNMIGGKIVHRHLLNGDVLLLNRQPTLHRPSIMAHTARILKNEKTLRMHYSNCKSYNADFDGDEMNAHCPQNELARSEAYNLVNVANQYLVPKDGTPLGGLIQDHMIAGVKLTVRGRFFNREDYHQLVYQALSHLSGDIKLLAPCIWKPVPLWSGKQVLSTVLINIIPSGKKLITLNSSAKIKDKSWEKMKPRAKVDCMSEGEVIIRNGRLLCGVLDKQHYGSTPYSLTHCIYELYGGNCSTMFLSSLAKLFTSFLQWVGFTIGVEDILVAKKQDKKRKKIIKQLRKTGDDIVVKALELNNSQELKEVMEERYYKEGIRYRAILDRGFKSELDSYTNDINTTCLSEGLIKKFPENNLQLMVTSGAKGSTVNTMQISCLLGQIELEGKRPPLMISGKSLPSFQAFDTSPRAGGFVDGRFMTGIRPQEFFFHCMAGREGLIDTAVKTSRSGYLQRCLIKHLEGVMINYDMTVRDSDGSVIQFAYGEDGMDVGRAKFLRKDQMKFLYDNHLAFFDKHNISRLKEDESIKKIKKWKEEVSKCNAVITKRRKTGFTQFCEDFSSRISAKHFKTFSKSSGRSSAAKKMVKKWRSLDETMKSEYQTLFQRQPDPVASVYKPDSNYTSISETLEKLINEYCQEKDRKTTRIMRDAISYKSMCALAPAGEPVGLLASQSVGEPSTQMTLNTFHFAGRGEMNVTLGIPRLREILMTASKSIKTPYMEIPFKKIKKVEKRAETLKKVFQRVTVSDVLEKINVTERLQLSPRQYTYTVRFQFLPPQSYRHIFIIKPKTILEYMEKHYLKLLTMELVKIGRKHGDLISVGKVEANKSVNEEAAELDEKEPEVRESKRGTGEEHMSSDEEEGNEDDDATLAKSKNKHTENQEYEEPDESEAENSDIDDPEGGEELSKEDAHNSEIRQNKVINSFSFVNDYQFDTVNELWCEVVLGLPLSLNKVDISTMLRDVSKRAVIYEIPNIKRAIVVKNNDDHILKTDGINMAHVYNYDNILDINKLYSNNVHEVAATYGIEAAGRVLVKEIKDVFKVYGIEVDPRHLLLIADYMTFEGVYLPMNRTGMENSSSPFQQISFESSTAFLKNALLQRKYDRLQSASARLMVGQPCLTGTGCMTAYCDLKTLLTTQGFYKEV